MSEQQRVRVFSNGEAYRTWLHNNCARCVKASDCPLEEALSSACVLDGTITPDIAARLGVPADGSEHWWCRERQTEEAMPTMPEPEQRYVSKKACGCLGVVVMERDHEAPKMVAAAMKRGETVERMAVEAVRATPLRCAEHRKPAAHEVAAAGTAQLPGFDMVAAKPTERKYPS